MNEAQSVSHENIKSQNSSCLNKKFNSPTGLWEKNKDRCISDLYTFSQEADSKNKVKVSYRKSLRNG